MTEIEIARKLDEIDCLMVECSDYLVHRFFDHDSLKMLDEKRISRYNLADTFSFLVLQVQV